MVGETDSGDPVFEIRSVRLVLRSDATHFNRVAECSKCGREMPGAAVLSPADLDLTPHPVICRTCVSNAAGPMFDSGRRRALAPAPGPGDTTEGNGSRSGLHAAHSPDDARLAALEKGLADLATRVASASDSALAEAAADGRGARLDALEWKLDEAIEHLRAGGDLERSELMAAVDSRIAPLQAALELEAGRGLDERVTHDADSARNRVQEIGERLRQLEATVEVAEAGRSELQRTRVDLQEVETQLAGKIDRLADGVITQRSDLLATIDARINQVQAAIERDAAATRQDVVGAQDELRRGFDGVTERVREVQNGLDEALARGQSEAAAAVRAQEDIARVETRLTERLEGVVAGVVDQRSALLSTLEAGLAEVRADLDRAVGEDLRQGLERLLAQMDDRLDRLAERSTHAEERHSQALHAIDSCVQETATRLADAETAITAEAERLQALEDGAIRTAAVLSDLRTGDDDDELPRLREYLDDRLDRLAERAARRTVAEAQGLHEVDERVDETARRLAEALEAQRSELEADFRHGLADVRSAVSELAAADVERLQTLEDRAAQVGEELSRLRTTVDDGELAVLVEAVGRDGQRLDALEQEVGARAERLARAIEEQRAELESQIADGLAVVRSAVAQPVAADADRLQALEERAVGTSRQLSEIDELLSILDAGFGELKAGIDALKEANTTRVPPLEGVAVAFEHDDTQPLARMEPEPARKLGKRSAATAQLAATADELARRQRQLEAQMTTLERTSEATIQSAARAASQAAHLGPLSTELKALRDEVWAHTEALEKLSRRVEDIRKKTSTPASPTKTATPARTTTPVKATTAKAAKASPQGKAGPATKPPPTAKRAPRKPKGS